MPDEQWNTLLLLQLVIAFVVVAMKTVLWVQATLHELEKKVIELTCQVIHMKDSEVKQRNNLKVHEQAHLTLRGNSLELEQEDSPPARSRSPMRK